MVGIYFGIGLGLLIEFGYSNDAFRDRIFEICQVDRVTNYTLNQFAKQMIGWTVWCAWPIWLVIWFRWYWNRI
jgi:hypothetical protein